MNHCVQITPEMTRAQWLDIRRKGIGGSDVAAIIGANPYKTPLDIFNDKLQLGENEDSQSRYAYWGTKLEDVVASEFAEKTGLKIQRVNYVLSNQDNPWMMANLDRAVVNPDIAKRVAINKPEKVKETGLLLSTDIGLECKTASVYNSDDWGPSQLDEILAGDVFSDHKIPLYYETQVQWYMAVTGMKTFYLAVLLGGNDFRVYLIHRDDELISALVSMCKDFWDNHVMKALPPDPVNAEDVKKLFAKDSGDMIEATNDDSVLVGELRNIEAEIKKLKAAEEELKEKLITRIGPHLGITIDGEKAVSYKSQTSRRFSSTQFKKDFPDLYEQYTVEATTRVFRIH